MFSRYQIDEYRWFEIENGNISDMSVGNHYAGCVCSHTDNRVYCNGFVRCFVGLYKSLSNQQQEEVSMLLSRNMFDRF